MLIFRTSWLYGNNSERNFINSVLKWSEGNEHIKITTDEYSIPTSTRLVADLTVRAINNNLTGIYHLVSTGYASRYDWAKIIIELYNIDVILYPALVKDFPVIAKRPPFSAMSNKKISTALQIEIPHWKTEFIEFVERTKKEKANEHPNLRQLRSETGILEL
jgi:dTDP-4-dehydrorhamnose reductase